MTLLELLNTCAIARANRNGREIRTGHCVWCDAPLRGRQRRWCSEGCVRAHRTNHTWTVARAAALARDGYRCVRCGAHPGRDGPPWQLLEEDFEAFQRRQAAWLAGDSRLEVNHITPCRGQHGALSCAHHLDGLETLCRRCHLAETARQFRRRRAEVPGQQRLWQENVLGGEPRPSAQTSSRPVSPVGA